ncbi:DUF2703 domain-containing protein [Cupriavidus sp. RAF12]|uniref:DUF2703 domain-containing protein n=1 Tax=Cupriavidus sp. RAF12 TaxID=3233050 RepID=UPI003F8DA253
MNVSSACRPCEGRRGVTEALRPLGIEPTLEVNEIDEKTFQANPSESNRIWIAGKSMDDWLETKVGSSRCCSVCGESECRTVQIGANSFDTLNRFASLASHSQANLHQHTDVAVIAIELARATDNRGQGCETSGSEP